MQQIQHKNVVGLVDYIEDATFPQEHQVCVKKLVILDLNDSNGNINNIIFDTNIE